MKRAWLFVASTCAAAACHVDEAAEVGLYREVLERGMCERDLQPLAVGERVDVRRAMLLANARSEALSIGGEALLRACIDRRRIAAEWLPRIELSPSYFARDAGGGVDDGLDIPLTASLDSNPRAQLVDGARADLEVARQRALLFMTQDALLVDVARTLYEVLRAETSARVLRGSLAVQEARVDDARARRDVGFARPLDVSLSESSLADVRVALLAEERDARAGRALLSALVSVPMELAELDAALDPTPAVRAGTEGLERAREMRPDLAAARIGVEIAARGVERAGAQWWPSIALDLAAFLERDSTPTDQDWRALFEVRLPLFSGGRIRADVREALSELREAKLRLAQSERDVRRDLEVALANLESGERRSAALALQLSVAREASAQAEDLYSAGLATNLERLTAQDDALRVELEYQSALLERNVSQIDLWRAAGVLHEWLGLQRTLEEHDAAPR